MTETSWKFGDRIILNDNWFWPSLEDHEDSPIIGELGIVLYPIKDEVEMYVCVFENSPNDTWPCERTMADLETSNTDDPST